MLTTVQLATLRVIGENPTGRLEDWARIREVSVSAIWQACRILTRKGYLAKVDLGHRSSHFVLTGKCGCCAHCRRPMLVEAMHEVTEHETPKLDPSSRQRIRESRATPRAIAQRFGIDESYVRKIRRRERGAA